MYCLHWISTMGITTLRISHSLSLHREKKNFEVFLFFCKSSFQSDFCFF